MAGWWERHGQSQEMTNRWFGCEGQAGRAGQGMGDSSEGFCLGSRLNISHASICTPRNVLVGNGQYRLRVIKIIIISSKALQTGFGEEILQLSLEGEHSHFHPGCCVWAELSEFKQEYSRLGQNQICQHFQVPEKQI